MQGSCEAARRGGGGRGGRGAHELLLAGRHPEEAAEAVVRDRVEQGEELEAVVGVVLKVARDHVEGALEDGLEDEGHALCHRGLQPVDDDRKQGEYLRIPAPNHSRLGRHSGSAEQSGSAERSGSATHSVSVTHSVGGSDGVQAERNHLGTMPCSLLGAVSAWSA